MKLLAKHVTYKCADCGRIIVFESNEDSGYSVNSSGRICTHCFEQEKNEYFGNEEFLTDHEDVEE